MNQDCISFTKVNSKQIIDLNVIHNVIKKKNSYTITQIQENIIVLKRNEILIHATDA